MSNLVLALSMAAFAWTTPSLARAADYDQNFDGTWIGAIKMIDSSLYNPVKLPPEASSIAARPMELAVEIEGGSSARPVQCRQRLDRSQTRRLQRGDAQDQRGRRRDRLVHS